MADLRRINPGVKDIHTIAERVQGRDMSPKLRGRFGVSIPILQHMQGIKLERIERQPED
jgi:hypothetical protein